MKIDVDLDEKREIEIGDGGRVKFRLRDIAVKPGKKVNLKKDFDTDFTGGYDDKAGALQHVAKNVQRLSDMQEMLYAQDVYSVLIIFQAMDAAGKDGAIRHVMSGINPQGCQVTSFKAPTSDDLDHDYLRRASVALPGRGMIGIFNRSYYEEVVVVRVHPELLIKQKLPVETRGKDIWEKRFKDINNFEKYLRRNGTIIVKFFLNVSKKEQKRRFLSRIDEAEKNWKFSPADFAERQHWDDYQKAFEEMLSNTSTQAAPWFVIPADNKWFARLAVSEVITAVFEKLELAMPVVDDARRAELQRVKAQLLAEVD
ncbi:PPK2 family polyphosphate:nucleotide phosphotransferase [Pararhizobium capsulatum DSM 1112]|uniref:PPK2 family polyphosphate:nucleotide phosphotransferase n=1 Tax=Pararhizobium capsulatum DSM 1112 TaxID=1121113 RepID=A0ABU0BXU7_9HYPH|nr:polyphosphate kinase 2 family protein [Pararhizobium capsulatum]MDQ0322250.1 PPK2 family polyphosphate:nucleotide phosphotransferase [Pararhizobium capsulatum DSM 1112]